MRKLVLFVGPQGSGKTTQALLLSKRLESDGFHVLTTTLSYSPIFQSIFIQLTRRASGTRAFKSGFYENQPAYVAPNPEIMKKNFGLSILLQLTGYVFSRIKLAAVAPLYDVVIDHEGYVIKQIADFSCLAAGAKIEPKSTAEKFLKFFEHFLLGSLGKQRFVILYLSAEHEALKPRYVKRNSSIEPVGYVDFQNGVFDRLVPVLQGFTGAAVVKVDSNQPIGSVHQQVALAIPNIER
jgi:hypothetical protein